MIRSTKHNSKDYIVVDTSIQIKTDTEMINVPVQVQVNITGVDPKKHYTVYRNINSLFNYPILFEKQTKPIDEKKLHWKFWLKKK